MVSAIGLSYAVFLNLGASIRNPPVSVRLRIGRHSSCTYAPEYNTSRGWIGSDCPTTFEYPTWKRRSLTGETVRVGLAR